WHSWQIDYISPLRSSGGKKYVLVGVEVISGLTMAAAFASATGENIVKGLKGWFSTLPLPEEIQSDNGSHFTAAVVQDWAREEGIRWVFHT
ncbi:transposase family protein, partial [Salmonella sp. gx-f5]|nr:transposase family protein [Salmonella sp. gx-f5]